jgi:hypothetical protein
VTILKSFCPCFLGGDELDLLANRQLERGLNKSVQREAEADGVNQLLLLQYLPLEVRQHIWSYLVVVPERIRIYSVKGSFKQGFRLGQCGDARTNLTSGRCVCNSGGLPTTPNSPAYLDTELLLVSL